MRLEERKMPVQTVVVSPITRLLEKHAQEEEEEKLKKPERAHSVLSIISNGANICKICHSETEKYDELITPCYCSGSLLYVHQGCVQKWIRATDAKQCELCQYQYKIESTVKPFRQWKAMELSETERRKIWCSVAFHVIAATCIVWSLWVLIDRTIDEVKE